MKKQEEFSVGGSIAVTVIFAVMAIYTGQEKDLSSFVWLPIALTVGGIIMTIMAVIHSSNESAKDEQQKNAAKAIKHDSSFGNNELKLYFDSSSSKVTICATTTSESKQEEVRDFVRTKAVETDSYIVALDATNHKILKAKNNNGRVSKTVCNLDDELKALGITIHKSSPALKAYNDYAFVTDDANEFIAIVKSSSIQVLRYSDIVSISYEENGNNVYNKSLGGAVVGGLLFGGVGAIVGGNTAKATQNKEVNSMSIKILLKSTSNPTIILNIYSGVTLKTKDAANRTLYEGLMKEVTGIKDIFSIIIDVTDKHSTQAASAPTPLMSSTGSVADELAKLAKLKEAGILSEEEFNAQKSKLLNS
ncbi:MAG: SHOCT domain-containing protein [Prevotella sp.]|nr:SHOCT domain-containing protein [Prevotella sp.]